ncbi:hypothetical protein B6N13_14215 [Marinomonas sp. UCMA 3892]|uniref:DUF3696 domain-containing protein n=1 Tax=Marinomonas sp. UCMA 3892 TaxID=1972585 RepID=UPI00146BB7E0|nr:DUF3696 domain-containing protein [Marinomonas sp. UCMA 3892]NLU99236.1 hypothetical protein [Marinomonas sp. UCMA 3892]
MNITSLIVGGFKGIDKKVTLPLAPITLFFGANSTGKSTLLQAMLYLYEVLAKRNLDAEYSSIAGESLYFGGFHNLVHGKKSSGTITLGATLDFTNEDDVFDDYLSDSERWWLENTLEISPDMAVSSITFELDLKWDRLREVVFVSRYECFSQGQTYIRFDSQAGRRQPVISFYEPLPHWEVDESFKAENLFSTAVWESVPLDQRDALPRINQRLDLSSAPLDWKDLFQDNAAAAQMFCEAALSQSSLAPLKILIKKLERLFHIGPIRTIPNRSAVTNKRFRKERWFDGSGGWDAFAYGNDALQSRVNKVFQAPDFLNTNYQFSVDQFGEFPQLEKRVFITETASGVRLLPTDIGVGISQVFPFIVATSMEGGSIVSCEQPELHIHPKWQLALGDMLLNATRSNPNKMFLIESHSEHLLLRLLKRRRDTSEGDNESYDCFKSDVQIIFCEQIEGKTRFIPIKTTDEGEFDTRWPNGFFDERVGELF